MVAIFLTKNALEMRPIKTISLCVCLEVEEYRRESGLCYFSFLACTND